MHRTPTTCAARARGTEQPMPTTIAPTATPGVRRIHALLRLVMLLTLAAAMAFGADRLVRGPDFVDRLVVRNPTGYIVDVSLTDEDHDGLVPVAALEPQSTTAVESVIDPGDTWVFEFQIAGDGVGELRVTRERLERRGWRVVIP